MSFKPGRKDSYGRWRARVLDRNPAQTIICSVPGRASGVARRGAERPSKRGRPVSPGASKGPETTGTSAKKSAVLLLRANGALQFNVLCEDGPRVLLQVKKRVAAPETMGSGADMVLDSAAEENRQRCKQAGWIARQEARRKTISNSGRSGARLRPTSDGAGNALPTLKPLKASVNDVVAIKAPLNDP
ncbi:hypothetical protein ERJ75_000024300 [Trypanosoma vivax]|nr:hypothetical protein ERJ75_000951200 [Trypanosoma vivax]KAH8620818.1 hypothetical protein ERJ75_000024300 [Trypanosoma vivax]